MDLEESLVSERTVLSRAARILEAFTGTQRVLSLNDLTARSGLPKSTTHRLAGRLVELGWLEREVSGYRIGMRLFEAGRLADRRVRLHSVGLPHLQYLASETQLATSISVLAHGQVICLEHLSTSRFRLPIYNGARLPATCTALGKVLLAHAPAATLDEILDADLPRRTEHSITDPAALAAELVAVRQTGTAWGAEEMFARIECAAAPVWGDAGLIAAISVSGPVGRIRSNGAIAALRSAASDISADYAAIYRGPALAVGR